MTNNNEETLETEFHRYNDLFVFAKVLNALNPDMDDLSLALKSASAITDLLKKAASAADSIKNADLIETIANLKLELAKLKSTLASAEERILEIELENKKIKKENESLKQARTATEKLVLKGGLYFQEGDSVPFCPNCWEKEAAERHLALLPREFHKTLGFKYTCGTCQKNFA